MISRRFVLLCLLTICGSLCFILLSTKEQYTDITFSRESGFYEEPFELELHAPVGTKIYYTLDGSEPNEEAFLYQEPILIDDATNHENTYSLRTDVVWNGFSEDNKADYGSYDPKYVVPDYLIDKCTVVRASYRDADGNFSKTKTASYFIDFEHKSGYDEINILSITTDPLNLFDYETGIYVFPFGLKVTGNYVEHGIEWEREATIQLFNKEKKLFLDQDCGIRIQGGMSRGRLPKSLNLYSRKQYSKNGRFYADIFGTTYMAETMTLFAGGEDVMSKCKDMLTSELTLGRNFAVMHYKPCAMFLNGEYWGFYWLTEKYDDVYFKHYYDVDEDNVIMIKSSALAEGEESDYTLYMEMMDYLANTDLSTAENYKYACELIDIQSCIDYYASEIYIGHNSDWPSYNEGVWRARRSGNGEYEDGKWRWLLYDVDSAFGDVSFDTFSSARHYSDIFDSLCQNEDFKRQFVTTFMDLANTSFAKENVDLAISECIEQMEAPIANHLKRFFAFENNNRYLKEIEYIQNFFNNRRPFITQYLKQNFELAGTLVPVTIEINNESAGKVLVNTIDPKFDGHGSWQGEYFTDYPIELTAIANDGYRFVRWDSNNCRISENDCIELTLDNNGIFVKAVFEKAE